MYGIRTPFFFEINTSTAALTTIGVFPVNFFCNSLVSDSVGNLLTVADDSIYQIDTLTAQLTNLGFYGVYASAGDLTFYNHELYVSVDNNRLVKIILQPNTGSQLIGTMQATHIYGINTVCYNDTETMIASGGDIGFSSLYIVNPANASLTLLCDTIVHHLIYGATSRKDFSSSKYCFVAGIDIPAPGDELKLLPNPATTELRIQNSELKIDKVEIYSPLGEKVFESHISNLTSQIPVDVSRLPSGIYFLRVKTGKEISTAKFVKQ